MDDEGVPHYGGLSQLRLFPDDWTPLTPVEIQDFKCGADDEHGISHDSRWPCIVAKTGLSWSEDVIGKGRVSKGDTDCAW
jgi:hypothetical protein